MIHLVQPYIDIALKLITGMIGILVFLRITGKAQLAQITPLDTVSAFVIGAFGRWCFVQSRHVYVAYSLCLGSVDGIQYACSFCYAVGSFAPFLSRERACFS